jgi:hypothetical protein
MGMSPRSVIAALACAAALAVTPSALASYSVDTGGQIAWVRRAASNFVSAELSGNGAGACAILAASLRATQHHRSCAQRWNAKLATLLRKPGDGILLRREQRAIRSAPVIFHGDLAWIHLPAPLIGGRNRFRWTENCWMLES